jgi:hypothetical protein
MKSVEHVDLHALYKRKVRLGYTPDILTDAGESNRWTQFTVTLVAENSTFTFQKWQIRL